MNHYEESWKTSDGLSLYAQGWEPEGEPRGIVCLVHGLGEHSGRYVQVGEFLAKNGYALLGFDLRGFGKSEGLRGHVESYERYMQDIDLLLQEARKRYTDIPVFLYGHSLGSMLVLDYIMRRKPHLAGAIVTGSVLRNALQEQKGKINLARMLGAFFPRFSLPTGLDASQISKDEAVVRAYVNDPLVHNRMTLRTILSLLDAFPWTFTHARSFPDVPLLMMHGSEDLIAYPSGTQEFADLVPGEVTVKYWDGMRHEIHNEPGKEQVLAYMVSWLDSKTRVVT